MKARTNSNCDEWDAQHRARVDNAVRLYCAGHVTDAIYQGPNP